MGDNGIRHVRSNISSNRRPIPLERYQIDRRNIGKRLTMEI